MTRFFANLGNLAPALRLALLAAFALLISLALDAQRAAASCGDYVRVAHPHAALVAHAASPAAADAGHRGMPPAAPCSGPSCRGEVPIPLAPPPAPPAPTVVEQLAILIALAEKPAPDGSLLLEEAGAHLSSGYSARLERPPRS